MTGPEKTSAIFIDGGNTHGTQKMLGWWIDFPKALQYLRKTGNIRDAYYFSGIPPADNLEVRNRYLEFRKVLINEGYTVIDKEAKRVEDRETQATRVKANLDVEFTMYVMSTMNAWDEAILFTGDSDFAPLAMYLRQNGKEVVCVGARGSLSLEMRNAANQVIELRKIRKYIERKKKGKSGK